MPYMRTTQLALIMTSLMTIGTVMAQNEPSGDLQEMPSENGARQEHRSDRAEQRSQHRDNRAEHRSDRVEQRSQRRDNRAEHRGRAQGRVQRMSARTQRSRR